MARSNPWMVKAPQELKDKLDQIRVARIKNGKENQMTSYKRLLLAISRHDKFLNDLATADFLKDKRGQMNTGSVFNMFTFMVTAFLFIVFCAGLIYVQGLLGGVFHDVGVANPQMGNWTTPTVHNMTQAGDLTFGAMAESIKDLRMVSIVYILSLIICMIITNALQKMHPMWFFVYILISILAIIFSVPISNGYQTLQASGIFNGELSDPGWGLSNFIMEKLPVFVLIISILGGVFLFINLIRSGNETGGLQ